MLPVPGLPEPDRDLSKPDASEDKQLVPSGSTAADTTAIANPSEAEPATVYFAVAGKVFPPGWALLRESAVKLWLTLGFIGPKGTASQKDLAERSGLSERLIGGLLSELEDFGVVESESVKGQGTSWKLLKVPESLPKSAKKRYGDKLAQKEEAARRRSDELKQAKQTYNDAVSGDDLKRFNKLAEETAPGCEKAA